MPNEISDATTQMVSYRTRFIRLTTILNKLEIFWVAKGSKLRRYSRRVRTETLAYANIIISPETWAEATVVLTNGYVTEVVLLL